MELQAVVGAQNWTQVLYKVYKFLISEQAISPAPLADAFSETTVEYDLEDHVQEFQCLLPS